MQSPFPAGVATELRLQIDALDTLIQELEPETLGDTRQKELCDRMMALQALCGHLEENSEERSRVDQLENEVSETKKQLKDVKSRMTRVDRMTSLGTLVAGVAHELKNPLNYVNNLSILSNDLLVELKEALELEGPLDREHVQEVMEDLELNSQSINEHGERAARIIQDIMDVAGGKAGELHLTDFNTLVDDFANMAYHGARFNKSVKIRLDKDLDPKVGQVVTMPQSLGRVLINLINNAVDALTNYHREQEGGYEPVVKISTRSSDHHILLVVADNGPGVPEAVREKIFQPFYSTKEKSRSNLGLGLSISRDIVSKELGGVLTMDSREDSHTTFTIRLPRKTRRPEAIKQ